MVGRRGSAPREQLGDVARLADERAERRALTLSLAATVVVGGIAIVWGIVAGARMILFDGVFTIAGIVLVSVSFLASRAAGKAPTREYPFGRHAATPLAVGLQGAALLGTVGYGAADALLVILDGGSDAASVSLFVYGLVSASAALIVMLLLRPYARRSALALAEFASWRAGMVLSLVAAAGGGVGILLAPTAWAKIVPFLDPVLVLLACATVVPMALGLVRQGMRELLGAAPPPDLQTAIDAAISDGVSHVGLGDDLPRPIVRASKLGRRLLVEVDFVVSEHAWSVDEEDVLRRAITDRLDALGYQTWATIELTTDPALAAD